MPILAIDTTGGDCAVLAARDGAEPARRSEAAGRAHAERLAPMTREALAEAGLAPGDLTRIAVATGPGSFAGIRVGVAFARGLALTLGVPALGVSLFDLWAAAHPEEPLLIGAHDARRGEVAWRPYRHGAPLGDVTRAPLEAAARAIAALAGAEGADPAIAGSAAGAMAALIDGARALDLQGADLALMAALARRAAPEEHPPAPLYVRPPDAKLPGGVDPAAGGREP